VYKPTEGLASGKYDMSIVQNFFQQVEDSAEQNEAERIQNRIYLWLEDKKIYPVNLNDYFADRRTFVE
jgi:hypothetical protein